MPFLLQNYSFLYHKTQNTKNVEICRYAVVIQANELLFKNGKFDHLENIIVDDFNSTAYADNYNVSNSEIADIKLRSLMIFRKDLPDKKLRQLIFPVLAAPQICKTAIALPQKYWSEEFSIYWYY